MQKYIIILAFISMSCKGQYEKNKPAEKAIPEIMKTPEFQLIKAENQQGLLILFPCFPCDAENTLSQLDIVEISIKNGYSLLAMNLNERLYLNPKEKKELAKKLTLTVREHKLSEDNIFIGGFSSGGNVGLIISDYLVKSQNQIQPKGVFIVDSPVDLLGLYKTAEKNLKLNFSQSAIAEGKWIKEMLDNEFGNPENGISNYERNSPFTLKTQNIDNLRGLKHLKLRFYTEPDLKWWKENASNNYEDLNAFYIEKLSEKLKAEFSNNNIELITTENKGYRVNGERHPHSWSIVDENDLLSWMKE